ncbi:hypothetical protein [Castellaniella sp.]|uniref:hypothetical protein n=1 Tax=Castellaniella sp. TaxID=1955812 RepID=UPI003562626A
MPLPGAGMLITLIDIAPADEPGFNHWFDKEHLPERVHIDGFIDGRRYRALRGEPRYLTLCATRSVDVLDGPAYQHAIAHPTEQTRLYISRFQRGTRSIVSVKHSAGEGHGASLAFITIARDPSGQLPDAHIPALLEHIVAQHDVTAAHWVHCDPERSRSFTDPDARAPMNAGYCLIEGTHPDAVDAQAQAFICALQHQAPNPIALTGLYAFMMGLDKAD